MSSLVGNQMLKILTNSRTILQVRIFVFFVLLVFFLNANAQTRKTDSADYFKIIAPGSQYQKSTLHETLWGSHYRKEWVTPATFPLFYLDTAEGGLVPYQAGGGRQSKSLRLRSRNNREYVLRSIDKNFAGALEDIYRNTFIEKIINDQVSIAHPYAAVTVAPLAEAARIYHTWPKIIFLPEQKDLDSFNKEFGNQLYLFEQRPDENWEDAPNFGNSKSIIGTDKLLEKIIEKNNNLVNQRAYIRARLFDMFIGDWGRHEDQWRWAESKQSNSTTFTPIPRDRDQTYTKFDGILLGLAKSAAGISHHQTFDQTIRNVETYNFAARHLDRRMANEMSLQDWISTASELQNLLTNDIIRFSVQQMPPEIFHLSGEEIIQKLLSRRAQLSEFARAYYLFLAKEVDIPGTEEEEIYEIGIINSDSVKVNVFAADGNSNGRPIYSRIFQSEETAEIRIYGIEGKDRFEIKGGPSSINIKVVGGAEIDHYINMSNSTIALYDSKGTESTGNFELHLSDDTAVHAYSYEDFRYDKKGISPSIFYNRQDKIYAGIAYKITNYKWRRPPFANKHNLYARYSLNQRAFSVGYEATVNSFVPGLDLLIESGYDWMRWTNFYGLGNKTKITTKDRDYHMLRSREALIKISLQKKAGRLSAITISPYYNSIRLIRDSSRYLNTFLLAHGVKEDFSAEHFGGVEGKIEVKKVDDNLWPSRGYSLSGSAAYTSNLKSTASFATYTADLKLYFPLGSHLVLATEASGIAINGAAEFYQLPSIGGQLMRGYKRDRFRGEKVFRNSNTLEYGFNVRSFIFNGKMGFLGFYDQGRVWMENEKSDEWHIGFGPGLSFAPFNKLYFSIIYGFSNEKMFGGNIHVNFRRTLQ